MVSTKLSIKSLITAALLTLLALVAGCGGGGATDPFAPGPAIPALTVNPGSLNIYSGTPAVVTITSGVGPFQVFTSDAVVLPVTQVVSGAGITLTANSVDLDKVVTLTVRDAVGQTVAVSVTVKPSPLLGTLTVTQAVSSTCSGATSPLLDKAAICSGESGLASVTLRAANTSVLPNRQIRFDVVQGAYSFVLDQAGLVTAKTITIVTDQNGKADAVIRMDASASSQTALIRATDLTSGNRVDSAFSIVQAIDGKAVLSVIPGSYTAGGGYVGECLSSSGDYIIYGGTPPYTVRSSLPGSVSLSVNLITGDPVIVPNMGGTFKASTFFLASCGTYSASIVVQDATGKIVTVSYTVNAGTTARPTLPALRLSPTAVSFTAVGGNCGSRSASFVVIGGSGSGFFTSSSPSATMNGGTINTNATFLAGESITVTYLDGGAGSLISATVSCVAAAP